MELVALLRVASGRDWGGGGEKKSCNKNVEYLKKNCVLCVWFGEGMGQGSRRHVCIGFQWRKGFLTRSWTTA